MKTQILIAALIAGTAVNAEMAARETLIRTSDMSDADIYSSAEQHGMKWDAEIEFGAIDPEWNRIGEIEDVILDTSGKVVGVIAEVGGFLDIGDKHVMLTTDEFSMFRDQDDDDDYVFVTGLTAEMLTDREDLDDGWWE